MKVLYKSIAILRQKTFGQYVIECSQKKRQYGRHVLYKI